MLRPFLEILRIILIILILGTLFGSGVIWIYHLLDMTVGRTGYFLITIADLIFIFILYRNKFQFHGFYKGQGRQKLSAGANYFLMAAASIILLAVPFFN